MTRSYRCSTASEVRDEPLIGTASTVTRFLLLEDPGPWGVDALADSRLPLRVRRELAARARRHRVRVLLIRRYGRSARSRAHCFAVSADPGGPWAETAELHRVEEVLDLDLAVLRAGRSLGLAPHPEPLLLVCTQGRHDPCCAERGRPLARALSRSHPDQTWECSHVGGDRFAGNLVVLPEGLYFGRVDAQSGPRIAQAYAAGRLDLDHLRGRVSQSFAVQAAEWHLRTRLSLVGLADVRLLESRTQAGHSSEATFAADGATWRVRVRSGRNPAEHLTCHSTLPSPAPSHDLLDITALEGRRPPDT